LLLVSIVLKLAIVTFKSGSTGAACMVPWHMQTGC
jgi:hypothetical protein